MNRLFLPSLVLIFCVPGWDSLAVSQSWPTYRHDFGRSGYASADMDASRLQLKWTWASELLPDPAWDGPARWDAFAELKDLPAMRQYDACFHPVCDEATVYFGSSSQDTLFALEAQTGRQKWNFVAGGPIRIAPTLFGDRILFGCDDGNVYCLEKETGKFLWSFSPAVHAQAEQRAVLNNDRLISFYPVRSGVVCRDNLCYFAASFMPWRESYLCGINLETGKPDIPDQTFVTRHENATLEGPLLIAENRLIVPQGRIAPLLFDRNNGTKQGSLPGGGGVTIVLTEDGDVARAEGGRAARPGQVGVFKGKERVASFPRGRSIVVRKDAFYVIDRDKVFAASRQANELLWQLDFDEPLEIIMVGNSLIVGGRDQISAIHAKSGKLEWQTKVDGRVFGLAYGNGLLVAASDTGHVYGFTSDASQKWLPPRTQPKLERPPIQAEKLTADQAQGLLHRWVFHRSQMQGPNGQQVFSDKLGSVKVKDLAGRADLELVGSANSKEIGTSRQKESIELGNGMFPVDEKIAGKLPTKQISVESWVRIDQTTTWGGIVGCIQDDGATEHGWLLGYNGDRFSFAVAGTKVGLTYLKSQQSYKTGNWYHVAGCYDGQEMRLFVNGKQVASSTAEKGPISYADKKHFTVGAYKDANESFPLKGALNEVRIYDRVLRPEDVQARYERWAPEFLAANKAATTSTTANPFLAWGPYLRFTRPGVAEISYGTKEACETVVEWGPGESKRRLVESQKKNEHLVELDKLPVKRVLSYAIRNSTSDESDIMTFELDTHFDWTRSQYSEQDSPLLKQLPNPKGMAFVFGKGNEEVAMRLSQQSRLSVVYFAQDSKHARELRQRWAQDKSIAYGNRLSVSNLDYKHIPAATAALVVLPQGANAESQSRHGRLVRPSGGILSDGKQVVWKRGKVAGGGDWTHMYGLPDNSAFGGEELADASNRDDLVANWIGKPGPRYQTDRQNRKPAPLAANGRLFLQGQQRMIAMDSYSGTILWSVESPTVMRWNVPRDSANWCADEQGLFVAAEHEAWFLNGRTGQIQKKYPLPDKSIKKSPWKAHEIQWGFIARHKNLLLGSAVRADAIYKKWWGKTQWFDTPTGGDTHLVTCDSFFALDHESGGLKWNYDGLILHPTITVLDNKIYFVEDKTPEHKSERTRRISIDKGQNHELVCLDAESGRLIFRQPLDEFSGKVSALYLAGGGNDKLRSLVLVASEATQKRFSITCLDPGTGDTKWKRSVKWEANHHGKHISRPAIENDLVYLRPEVLNLADGKTIKRGFPSGHGCASYTLSKNGLFSRLGETTWWDVRNDKVSRFSRVRTDCWISAIPAQGMLLSAEGGGGCSCGSWLETSIGFLPRKVDQTFPTLEKSTKN